jgi:riboflavin biosynthesis pyrimidine reductase
MNSGGTLNGVFLMAILVDEVSLPVYPALVEGMHLKSIFERSDLNSIGP